MADAKKKIESNKELKNQVLNKTPKKIIPKQALTEGDGPPVNHEPNRPANPEKRTQVIVKQTPIPEVKIYGGTHPRKYTFGMKASDKIAKWGGSWGFISIFMAFLIIWMLINFYLITVTWDPYPFILLNLVLSCLAAIQAPVILMSQNRAAERDRVKAERDYAVNRKSEREIELIKKDLDYIKKKIMEVHTKVK